MALSNKFGWLLLSTGNKSEVAVGYSTLYGDSCGGLALIGDVSKTMVYQLSQWINQQSEQQLIPTSTLTKPPSAELRPGQLDSDSLPDYDLLDSVLEGYIERHESPKELADKAGCSIDLVEKIISMVDRNEYKRQQLAPCLRVTSKAFGYGRRMPIAQHFDPSIVLKS
jgi:NAD+ synthetase